MMYYNSPVSCILIAAEILPFKYAICTIYTYKRVVCVCLLVCPLFIGHTTFVHFAALAPSGREQPSRRGPGGPARAGKRMHSESTRACRTTSQRKNRSADAFQKQNRTRARMLSYYSLPSLGVFTFRIVLNRTSSLVGADLGQLVMYISKSI